MKTYVKFSSHRLPFWVAALLAALTSPPLWAATHQSHASIQQTALRYVEAHADQFQVTPRAVPGRLDSRLRLALCSQPLEAFEAPGGLSAGRGVVGVRCEGAKPWKIYVPVTIELPAPVLAVVRDMRRGDIIAKDDLVTREADLAALRGQYFSDPAEVVGLRIKRHLAANLVLTPAMLDARRLVERGAEVTILAATGAIEVRMRGKAMAQGGRGERIEVKNLRSGRVINAVIIDRDLVKANL